MPRSLMTLEQVDALDVAALRRLLAAEYPFTDRTVDISGQLWRVTAVESQDALLDTVHTLDDLENFPYGLLFWPSAIGLAQSLLSSPAQIAGEAVLELGCGTGIAGMIAHSIGARVVQTDYQPATLALARVNAEQNRIPGISRWLLDWRARYAEEPFELVIGSDVLYERTLHAPLARLLGECTRPEGRAVLSDPFRPQAVEFIQVIEELGWKVEMASEFVWWEGERREIALYTLTAPLGVDPMKADE